MAANEELLLNLLPPKKLIKMLGSSCKKTRESGLQIFLSWLPQQNHISSTDLKNIWKGLFYSLWHADKLQFQSNLIDQISSLILDLPPTIASLYSSLFFLTMHREWSGIDILRLNKYYLFIRRFIHHLFLFLKNKLWDLDVSRGVMGDLEEGMFNYKGKIHGNGVNYHVVSVFLEELRPFLPLDVGVLEVLFGPFLSVVCRSEDKVLVEKAKVSVFDALVRSGRGVVEACIEGGDLGGEVILGSIVNNMCFSERFYALGSSGECSDCNRKVVLRLHEDFVKAERDLKGVGEGVFACFGGELSKSDGGDEEEMEVFLNDHSEEDQGLKKKRKKKTKSGKKRQVCAITYPDCEENPRKKAKKIENLVNGFHKQVTILEDYTKESNVEVETDPTTVEFNENFISDLRDEFERVAAEKQSDAEKQSVTWATGNVKEKRKRTKRMKGGDGGPKSSARADTGGDGDGDGDGGIQVLKKVTFAMRNNMVWKPHNPLPPQSVRIPPSLTPRGSALKKGVLPGPIAPMNRSGGGANRGGGGANRGSTTAKSTGRKKKMKKGIILISPLKGIKVM